VTSLTDLVDPLKRYVAVPGTFDDVFPDTTDEDLLGSLLDGFAEAQLDGFFIRPEVSVTDDGDTTPDLSRGEGALIAIYASTRIVLTQLMNLRTQERYEARGLISETSRSSQVLTALLKDLTARKTALITRMQTYAGLSGDAGFTMADQYFARAIGASLGGGDDRAYDYHYLSGA
jgi:hypothetical protein